MSGYEQVGDINFPPEATGTEQDIPAAGEARERALSDIIDVWAHNYANDAWRALTEAEQMAVAERIARAVRADHHHALSEAVQAEHDRWVEKLRAKLAELELHDDTHHPYDEGFRDAWREFAALLAEAEASDAADERRKESSQ